MLAKVRSFLTLVVRSLFPELRLDSKSFRYLLGKRAVVSSVEFVQQHMLYAEPFETREGLYQYAVDRAPKSGLILEFGVHNGNSINAIAALTEQTVHGFDSFEGLPSDGTIPMASDGGVKWFAGKMDMGGLLPNVRDNVQLYKGWFDSTLPEFYQAHTGDIALLHIDCDIYSSTKCVFDNSKGRIGPGTIIIFDEYLNFEGWERHEHRALTEFAADVDLRYEFIAYTYLGGAVVRVLGIDQRK